MFDLFWKTHHKGDLAKVVVQSPIFELFFCFFKLPGVVCFNFVWGQYRTLGVWGHPLVLQDDLGAIIVQIIKAFGDTREARGGVYTSSRLP